MGTYLLYLRILLYENKQKHTEKEHKMKAIGSQFHFKAYVWEIVDRYQNGYALQRKTKNHIYDYNGWVTENYTVFEVDQDKPEQIKRPRYKTCEHCNESWEQSHFCKVLNSPERVKARQQKQKRIRLSGNYVTVPLNITSEEE